MIAPHAMNGRKASGLSLMRTPPSASSSASTGTPPKTADASLLISSRSISVAPLTAESPVTANWLAYVPEKPACEFQ